MYLITFHSNFDANALQKKLKAYGDVKRKPVPRELSASCGTCILFTPNDENYKENDLLEESFEALFRLDDGKYNLILEKE